MAHGELKGAGAISHLAHDPVHGTLLLSTARAIFVVGCRRNDRRLNHDSGSNLLQHCLMHIGVSPDGVMVVCGSGDGRVRVWSKD
jgi:WD40 repeat protein